MLCSQWVWMWLVKALWDVMQTREALHKKQPVYYNDEGPERYNFVNQTHLEMLEIILLVGPRINPRGPIVEIAPKCCCLQYIPGESVCVSDCVKCVKLLLSNRVPLWGLTAYYPLPLQTTIGHDWQLLLCLTLESTVLGWGWLAVVERLTQWDTLK